MASIKTRDIEAVGTGESLNSNTEEKKPPHGLRQHQLSCVPGNDCSGGRDLIDMHGAPYPVGGCVILIRTTRACGLIKRRLCWATTMGDDTHTYYFSINRL